MPLKMYQSNDKPSRPNPVRPTHTIAIAAGKGGVGKSSVTVNLAIALKRAGYAVGVLDADIYGPSIRRMLPEDVIPTQKGEFITPAISKGIRIISMAYFRQAHEATAVRAPIANGVISQFLKNVDWGHLDFLLIDFPPGTGDIQLTLSQQANLTGALMVTTPQEIALMDVRKAIHLFDQVNIPIIGILENMSYFQADSNQTKHYVFGRGGGERLANEIGAPFLGQIPIDPEICRCGDEGAPLGLEGGILSPGAKAFNQLAENFVGHVAALKRLSNDCLSEFELSMKEMS